jgi:adenylate kinase
MKTLPIVIVLALAGCGAEGLGTAAVGGAIKQQEVSQGKKTLEQAEKKVGAAAEQVQVRASQSEEQK